MMYIAPDFRSSTGLFPLLPLSRGGMDIAESSKTPMTAVITSVKNTPVIERRLITMPLSPGEVSCITNQMLV
ncbi:hypothetical protein SDC9_209594 [bioreactor metagenome]|uniref:Uncharacterized protein n=1 Tax=bioreactor metagenome TaxID=1076179 RepID=A0A645JGP5_9ZZZZ